MTETQAPALHAYMDYLEKTMIADRYESELGAAAYERVGALKPDMKQVKAEIEAYDKEQLLFAQ